MPQEINLTINTSIRNAHNRGDNTIPCGQPLSALIVSVVSLVGDIISLFSKLILIHWHTGNGTPFFVSALIMNNVDVLYGLY